MQSTSPARRNHPSRVRPALALLVCCAFARPAAAAPAPAQSPAADFDRHVMGLFGRMGCNSGSCHGSFQGKGGFRLSLFGYDPDKDFQALTRDIQGRRLNLTEPGQSLLLLKATGQVEHGGGRRFAVGSFAYQVMRDWIAGGARRLPGGKVTAVRVEPEEYAFTKPGEHGRLAVIARFTDGREEDVTRFCEFRTNDDAVAQVGADGLISSHHQGDTAVVALYRGNVRAARVLVPLPPRPGAVYAPLPEANFIDREVSRKLRRLNIQPSAAATDAEFLRRVTIDTIGTLPTPDDLRAFLADTRPDKRARVIDKLLTHPMHAALWATKFCDITGNNTDALENPPQLKSKLSQMWHDWFRARVAANLPYDQIVRGVLCATSRDGLSPEEWIEQVKKIEAEATKGFKTSYADRPSLDLFWRRQQPVPIEHWGEKVAAAFLGVRLECAQCHKHPTDRWTQAEYRAFANIFGQVTLGPSPDTKKLLDRENEERKKANMADGKKQLAPLRELFVAPPGAPGMKRPTGLADPDTGALLKPTALGGPVVEPVPGKDMREALFDWMRSADNPYFARSFANRVWGHYFGVGIVDPVDNFSIANPPSNPRLLDALAAHFVEQGYDIRALERTVLNSQAYQRSSHTTQDNRLDRTNASHALIRPMMAEVVVDVIDAALGITENFGPETPAGCRAVEIGSSRVNNAGAAYAFRVFGRPPRTTACDCERGSEPALPQKLYMMTDPQLQSRLQGGLQGRIKELLDRKLSDDEVLDELFLATLSRPPSRADREAFLAFRGNRTNRPAVFQATLWALINTREFILNH